MGKRKTRYIIEYDYVLMTVNHEEKPPEHRIEIHILFEEVEYVWPRLGYPPLVTPFSQYVKNVALMNVMHKMETLKAELLPQIDRRAHV